jgi:hypothetical protein
MAGADGVSSRFLSSVWYIMYKNNTYIQANSKLLRRGYVDVDYFEVKSANLAKNNDVTGTGVQKGNEGLGHSCNHVSCWVNNWREWTWWALQRNNWMVLSNYHGTEKQLHPPPRATRQQSEITTTNNPQVSFNCLLKDFFSENHWKILCCSDMGLEIITLLDGDCVNKNNQQKPKVTRRETRTQNNEEDLIFPSWIVSRSIILHSAAVWSHIKQELNYRTNNPRTKKASHLFMKCVSRYLYFSSCLQGIESRFKNSTCMLRHLLILYWWLMLIKWYNLIISLYEN